MYRSRKPKIDQEDWNSRLGLEKDFFLGIYHSGCPSLLSFVCLKSRQESLRTDTGHSWLTAKLVGHLGESIAK